MFYYKYYEIFFDRKFSLVSVDLLFLTKNNVGWFLLKRVDLVIVRVIYSLLLETIRFFIIRFFGWGQHKIAENPLFGAI